MMAGDTLLDAFINANILLVVGYGLWFVVRWTLSRVGLRHAYGLHLSLLHAAFVAIFFAPLIAMIYASLQQAGMIRALNINLSDMVVAYYLNGGLEMKASEFEALILSRDTFTLNVLNGRGWLAQGVIAIFVAGVAVGFVRLAYSIYSLWRIVAHAYTWRVFGRVRIQLSDRTLVPFSTRGLRNYYIVIPSHLISDTNALKVAMAHEIQHIRQGDLEWEVVLESLKPFFFLNPAYRAWKRQVEHLRELTCDSAVLARGNVGLRTYCETLLSICQKTLRRDRAFVVAVPKVTLVTADRASLFDRKPSFLEQRIRTALDMHPLRNTRWMFLMIAGPLLAVLTVMTLAIQSPGDWSQDRLMLSTVVNLDRLAEINRLSAFGQVRR